MFNFGDKLQDWLKAAQTVVNKERGVHAPTLLVMPGHRYARIVAQREAGGQIVERSAFAFIDMDTGDIHKPDGWKKPAKHARGNLSDEKNGMGWVTGYGIACMR